MSTQFDTGETTLQYWAQIAAGPAANPLQNASYVNATAAYVARNKAAYAAREHPVAADGGSGAPAMPSVGINAANNASTYVKETTAPAGP